MSKKLVYLMSFVLLLAVTGTASADQITITINNPGFEDPVLNEDGYTWLNTPGWTNVGGGGSGVWNTTSADFDPVVAPEGENVFYTETAVIGGAGGVAQVLTETFAANTDYTLTAEIGNSWYYYYAGYSVQLLAGGVVIAEDNDTLWPAYYEWATSTVAYTYDPADAALVGQPLEICLLSLALDKDSPPAGELIGVEFDDITLSYFIDPALAMNPNPANEQTNVPRDVILSWTPGESAAPTNGHKVYFGESFNDVNDGIGGITQSTASYSPAQRLEFGTTYYWRVDEIGAPPNSTVYIGKVWSFTTELFVYPIENVTATASSSNVGEGAENTVNDSGVDANDLHSTETTNMWRSSPGGDGPAWIEYEFDRVSKLHEMWVWNHNSNLEQLYGFGFKEVLIEYSVDGIDYKALGTTHEFAQAPGTPGYAHETNIDFDGAAAKYVRLTANSTWRSDVLSGLSEVRFFRIPVHATEPYPDSGATVADLDVVLGWRAGRKAASHDVYFSDDLQDVIDGIELVATGPEGSYGPVSLNVGTTYYWRVDEVNDAEAPSTWRGVIWDFSTVDSLVVDDFEIYDANDNQIWWAWKDGLGYVAHGTEPAYPGNGTGAIVGDDTTDSFTEETIVHGGNQSMPLVYNNNQQDYLKYSEATLALSSQRDWTARGVKELSLWFRGYPASVGSFTEGPVGTYTMTGSGADIWGAADEFHYAFKTLTGVGSIQARVLSVDSTNGWAKAGVMIRETLDPDSAHAMMVVTPAQGVSFQRRTSTGGTSASDTTAGITAPYWVKIDRDLAGNFTAYSSADSSTWQILGTWEQIQMGSIVNIGLAVTSHNADLTCQAVFSNVTTTGHVGALWANQDIGIASNDAEPLYVAVSNAAGAPAVVVHDDPDAATTDIWTPWAIPLQEFADQGVSLTNVDSIAIGLGTRGNATIPGGAGKIYFDDIRLYKDRSTMVSITVPDAGFDEHVLTNVGDYIDIADSSYTGAWKSHSGNAWIDYGYYAGEDDLPTRSGKNKAYGYDDYIYQILDETFIEGVTYTLSVWVGQAWSGYADGWWLYFTGEDYTNNLIEASGNGPVGSWGQVSLEYTATAADAGKKIGIKMYGNEYVTFEDVALFHSSDE